MTAKYKTLQKAFQQNKINDEISEKGVIKGINMSHP